MTTNQTNRFLTCILLITLIAYLIPWVVNKSTGLTLGAYDLAEWLSLHPATHPTRLPSLIIRGQLVLITLNIALSLKKPLFTTGWWIRLISVLLLVVAQLPPPEFLVWTGDQNQRQQALLAMISLVGGSIALTGVLATFRPHLYFILSAIGIISTSYVLLQILPRMNDFGLTPILGIGGFMLIGVYIVWIAYAIYILRNTNRATTV